MADWCPICYESFSDINVCMTICKHKFHTNCLMLSGNNCPICRTNINTFKPNSSRIPSGLYNMNEYIQQLNQHNISIDDLPLEIKQWLEECKEHYDIMKEIDEKRRMKEEKRKTELKKMDINKYNLFYGNK